MKEIKSSEIYLLDYTENYRGYGEIELFAETLRVIFFKEKWVFCDSKYDEKWELDKMRKGICYFAPTSRYWFSEKSLNVGFSEVSAELNKWFRTDLIIYIGRLKELSWNSSIFDDRNLFNNYLNQNQDDIWLSEKIDTDKIYLVGRGKYDGPKKPVLIEADDKKTFFCSEILWKAALIQREAYNYKSNGVGIFRSGSKDGIPTYYIGEYFDRAGILKRF